MLKLKSNVLVALWMFIVASVALYMLIPSNTTAVSSMQPEHIGIPVAGESGFVVDRRVWQAALYARFVRGPTKTFAYTKAIRWCLQVFPCRTEFAALQKNPLLLSPELRAALPWATRAVQAYLQELVQRGVLKAKRGGMQLRYEVLRRRAP